MEDEKPTNPNKMLGYGLFLMTLTHVLTHVFGPLFTASFPLIREEFSLSIPQLGLIAAIPSLIQSLLSIPAGILTDKVGSKKMLFVSLFVALAGSLAAAISANPLMLIIAVSLVQLNTTIYHPASYSYVTRRFRGRDRPKALGIHGAGGTFGMALGPLTLGVFLGSLGLGWRQVYMFWAIPLLVGTFMSLKLEPDVTNDSDENGLNSEPVEAGAPTSLLTKGMAIFLIYMCIRTIGWSMVGTFMPLFIVDEKNFTAVEMNYIYGLAGMTGLISAPFGGVLASKYGSKNWLAVSIGLMVFLLGVVAIVPGGILFVVVYIIYRFSMTLGMAARSNLVAKLTPSGQRGVGYALLFLPGSLMGAVSPMMAAYIIENFGMSTLFPISMGIYVVSLFILVFLLKEPPD
jgi:MFS family permease